MIRRRLYNPAQLTPDELKVSFVAREDTLAPEAGLAEPMEPLWHATRAELGEQLEPLPAEIMETVTDLRQEFSDMRH